jgi:predicted anti-sigma-YlaC factor YlaD
MPIDEVAVMNCKSMQVVISAFVDNELSREESVRVQEHLKQCSSCRADYAGLLQLKGAVARLWMTLPLQGFEVRVMERIRRKEENQRMVRALLATAGKSMACSAILLTLISVGSAWLSLIGQEPLVFETVHRWAKNNTMSAGHLVFKESISADDMLVMALYREEVK